MQVSIFVIIMTELTAHKLTLAFHSLGLTDQDYLTLHQLTQAINELNAGAFDQELLNQLWEQCKLNSKGQVKLSEFARVVMKGEQLLIDNLQSTKRKALTIEARIPTDQAEKMEHLDGMREIKALEEAADAINNSVAILRYPFRIQPGMLKTKTMGEDQWGRSSDNQEEHLFDYDSKDTAYNLTVIFYLTLSSLCITILTSFYVCKFSTIVVYLVILSGYGLQTISRKIVRFNIFLLLTDTLISILWLVLQISRLWSPPEGVQFLSATGSYLKLVVGMKVITTFASLAICFFYLTQSQIDELQVYTVIAFGKEINLKRDLNPSEPNSNPLAYFANQIANSHSPQDLAVRAEVQEESEST